MLRPSETQVPVMIRYSHFRASEQSSLTVVGQDCNIAPSVTSYHLASQHTTGKNFAGRICDYRESCKWFGHRISEKAQNFCVPAEILAGTVRKNVHQAHF